MELINLKMVCTLCSLLALADSNAITLTRVSGSRNRNHRPSSRYANELISICPTRMKLMKVKTAIHYRTRTVVPLVNHKSKSSVFIIGKCGSPVPLMQAQGVCRITMQRHRAFIRVTSQDVRRHNYKNCRRSTTEAGMQYCLEWIELPGLCQHKVAL